MDLAQFQLARDYVGFDQASADLLRSFQSEARVAFDAIATDFYETIQAHPESRAVLTGGQAQVTRLRHTFLQWLASGLSGPHDSAYLEARMRIGGVHVSIRLPQELMFTAMNRVRRGLLARARETLSGERLVHTVTALDQWLDLELAIMLDSYREHWAAQLRAGERLATIGQFAAAIGHELRNPLGVVESSMYLIGQRLDQLGVDDAVVDKHRQRIAQQVQGCSDTITGLLELARDTPPKRVQRPLTLTLESTLAAVVLPDDVAIAAVLDPALAVFADPFQLREVLSNLLRNAIEALSEGGRIEVRANQLEDGVEIRVEDDGPGIALAVRARVFDIWFSTKSHGTGLGLSLARKLVEGHGGTLTLEASERGAHFRIWLPRGPSPA